MRLLYINDIIADIDEETAIGITFQSYDIREPGKNFVKTSSDFTIPATAKNLAIFGFANNPQSNDTAVYDTTTCNYFSNGLPFIRNAQCRVKSIGKRIELFIFEKPSVWDSIKLFKWDDFCSEFITYLQDEKGLSSFEVPFTGNISQLLTPYYNSTSGVVLPLYFGNLYNYSEDEGVSYFEDENNIYLSYSPNEEKINGGHFCIYIKTVFEFIEWKYGVNFLTSGGVLNGNIWDDAVAPLIYTPLRSLVVKRKSANNYYFDFDTDYIFSPEDDVKQNSDKSLFDLVNSFFQHFNIIQDKLYVTIDDIYTEAIRLARFDDLENLAEVVDFSEIANDDYTFKPLIDGFSRENKIMFSKIYEDGNPEINSKVLTCDNKNVDATSELFTIDAFVCNFAPLNETQIIADLSTASSFETFEFFLSDEQSLNLTTIHFVDENENVTAEAYLRLSALYNLDSEYNFFDKIITYPKVFEISKWINVNSLVNFEFFKQYYIRELNGAFFINKISDVNIEKSNEPINLEVIKIGNKTPVTPPDLNYWTDGVSDGFVDGVGDYFF